MGVDSVKAGGSAGHGLVLSCQGAECHPWARSRGKSRVGMRGPPAWTSPVTPIVVECEEVEGMRGKLEERGLRSCTPSDTSSASTTDFTSSINVINVQHELCVPKQSLEVASSFVCLFGTVKIEVYLESNNSLWSAEGCHWKDHPDYRHDNYINKLIYWTGGSEDLDANKKLLFFVLGVFTATAKHFFSAAAASVVKCLVFSCYTALLRPGRELSFYSWTELTTHYTHSTPRIWIACVCVCAYDLDGCACSGIFTRFKFQYSASFSIYSSPSALNNKKRLLIL